MSKFPIQFLNGVGPRPNAIRNIISGLNDDGDSSDFGYGINDDGSYYVFDNSTGETLYDNLTGDQLDYLQNDYTDLYAAENGVDINTGGSSDGSGSGSSSNWYQSWGSGLTKSINSLLSAFSFTSTTNKTGASNTPNANNGGAAQNSNLTPASQTSAIDATSIIKICVIAAGLGALGFGLFYLAKSAKKESNA